MKRIDLIRAIRRRAKQKGSALTFREGGNHTIVTLGNCVAEIPRHREIPHGTIRRIVKELEPEFGESWLKII